MENSIEIFKQPITKLDINTVYATDDALGYFLTIRNELDAISDDLITVLTGSYSATPGNLKMSIEAGNNIDNFENFLKNANKNNPQNARVVIHVRDILVRFENIRCLMLHPDTNENFRRDAIQLFIKTGNLYPEEQIKEFIGYLSEEELKHILQIIAQERTLIEKTLTNSPIHILAVQRMNRLRIQEKGKADIDEER